MPRYTLFYDGDRSEQATAADVVSIKGIPGVEIHAQQNGLLLISASEKIINEIIPKFQGWVASKEQCSVHPKPKRPTLAPKPKK